MNLDKREEPDAGLRKSQAANAGRNASDRNGSGGDRNRFDAVYDTGLLLMHEQKNDLIHLKFYRWRPRRVVAYRFTGDRYELSCRHPQRIGDETVVLRRRLFARRQTKSQWWQPHWQLYVLRITCARSRPHRNSPEHYSFQLEQGGLYEFNCAGLVRRP